MGFTPWNHSVPIPPPRETPVSRPLPQVLILISKKTGNIKEETKISSFIVWLRELDDVRTFEWGI